MKRTCSSPPKALDFYCRKKPAPSAAKSIVGFLTIFACASLHSAPIQSLDALKNKIEQHILNELSPHGEGHIKVFAEKIDSRLNLKACKDEHLAIFNPYQTSLLSSTTMGIQCKEEDNHWTLYVPVKITRFKTVYVAKYPMIKGYRVTADDIYPTELDVQQLKQGYFTEPHLIVGQVCKQNISGDNPFNPYNIELPKLVHRGEQITITAVSNALNISVDGVAMNDGILGETIKVKNLSSKKIIEAQITDEKKVKIML